MIDQVSHEISRMATGERAALDRVYRLTSGKVFAILLRILRDRADAEDALQNVYVKAWRGAPRFDPSRSGEAWIATIARNVAIDHLRSARRHVPDSDEMDQIADPSQTSSDQWQMRKDLLHCLETLPAEQARAVVQVYLQGLSYQEVADILGSPLNTVRTWLRRSLLKLRSCLGGDDVE